MVQVYTQAQAEAVAQKWLDVAQAVVCYTQAGTEARTEAIARVQRLEAGTYTEADVLGLQDWADAYGWC